MSSLPWLRSMPKDTQNILMLIISESSLCLFFHILFRAIAPGPCWRTVGYVSDIMENDGQKDNADSGTVIIWSLTMMVTVSLGLHFMQPLTDN